MMINKQAVASWVRQACALAAFVFGILTAALSSIHLPIAVSAVMSAVGGGLFAVEHFVGDPSTGKPVAPVAPSVAVVSQAELDTAYRAGYQAGAAPKAGS